MSADPTPQERKASLLESADIRAWIKDHRSLSTAKLQLEQLELICRRTQTTADEFVRLASLKPNKQFRGVVLDWVESERKRGRPDQYLKASWYALKSWLRFNEVALEWSPPFAVESAETLSNERVPDQAELRRLLSVLSTRDRAAVLILATSGVRIGVLANRFEAGGLSLSALPDLSVEHGLVEFKRTPALVRVPTGLSKTKREYYTFISSEAAEALLAYLQDRQSRGERLTDASAVIGPEPKASRAHFRRGKVDSLFISGKSLGNVIRVGLRKVMPSGVRVRPHTLRAWTSTQLELAERKGKITRSVREYFLGHNLRSVELRYNLGKRLSPESLEELRSVYAACEPFLSTASLAPNADRDLTTRRVVLRMHGYSEEELTKIDISTKTDDELIALADAKRAEYEAKHSRPGQKAVPIAEVGSMLEAGWEYVAPLGPDRVVLRSSAGLPHPYRGFGDPPTGSNR